MNNSQVDLADLFAVAQQTIAAHQQEINDLDGYNGNNGDNMAQNMQLIVDALHQRRGQPPAAALEYASQQLQSQGRDGTSQYYAQGLTQAGGSVLDQVLSMSQAQPAQQEKQGAALGGLLRSLVPVALAFFRAQHSGTDATSAAGQALMGALTGSQQVNPLKSGTPRTAGGGLIAQSVLKALMGGR